MTHAIRSGTTGQIAFFRAYDTDGTAKTDLTSATSGLTLSVFRVGLAATSIASLTNKAADNTAHSAGAIRQVQGNLYTVDLPDAAVASQCPSICVKGTYTGGVIEGVPHPIVGYDGTAARVGASDGTGVTLAADQEVNVTKWGGTAVASAVVPANVTQISGDAGAADNLEAALDGTGGVTLSVVLGTNAITAASLAADAGAELAALVETYIVNEGDATAVMQAIADKIAADWVAGDASPLAIVAAIKADATLATMISRVDTTVSSRSSHTAANVLSALGTGTWATAIPWNPAWDAEVQSEVQDAIEANHLDHLLAQTYDPASKPGAADALLNELIGNDAGVSQFTANALELAPSGGGGSGDAEQATLLEVQDTVEAIALTLAGTPIQPASRVASGGTITAYIGDDFRVRSDTELSLSVADVGGALYTKWTALGASALIFGASREGTEVGAIAGTVAAITSVGSGASQTCKLTVEITNCGNGLKPGTYEYQIEQRQTQGSDTDSFIEIAGSLILKRNSVA